MRATKRVKFVDSSTNNNGSHVILNVGGMRFETQRTTLKKLPATRLSKLTPQLSFYDPVLNEYFFDRHPGVFSQILNYYRTGKLHYPTNVCGPLFEDELSYWGIQREEVEPCCWMTYTKHRSTQETLQTLDSLGLDTARSNMNDLIKKFDWEDDLHFMTTGQLPLAKRIRLITWQLFEESRSSIIAKIIAFISILFILLSITTFVLRTLSIFEITEYDFVDVYIGNNSTEKAFVLTTGRRNIVYGFDIIEWICNSWFTFEIVLRFILAPSKRVFCVSILNWIDFLGTFLFFSTYILYNVFNYDGHYASLDLLSTIRVARMFKLINLHPRLRIITTSISYSSRLLVLSIYFCFVVIMIAGAALYYVERLSDISQSQIISVMDGIWLALTTVTTIGYGDIVPKSLLGMILGAVTTIFGVLIIDLPMPIVNEIFDNFNKHLLARQQLPKQRRRVTQMAIPRKIKPFIPTNRNVHHQHET
ncbi:unnamed protein product [Rotaria magnacalcarata]|uniref:BTB domain-containing protein n=1 Tax=Rotaria magnacalcarata TaxID=392030 RepID=A0A816AZQ1_9BILA|nr:unnamed protein product [Rotaria magnacalcarata]CAF1602195.1 unnamed protein product [Rotaria magnacalcarata]CAF1931608.1 unnamed protein product [Rotaria magnacalcarata]CAF1944081.1 unnamed protein product [Rotaria magnacalcarata]CAF3772222.1 unnamed protein product [Rotaria magnacalcarata]